MNYGHALEFGTFITPGSDAPEQAVELARLSERLGYDLVTFQDHPYNPALLDTWTLMSWVAGQTSRIRISANVLNIPLRQPAVLGRAANSLDLLSSGRLTLALGAGGFWSPIAAMGGPRHAPGEAVGAFSEAIDVIRGMITNDPASNFAVNGNHYRVSANPGPMSAHDIPIWVGAYKPRMLRLIGEKADGWLSTLQYLQPGDLAAGNAIIDEAAIRAGRDPREIRRVLNIRGTFSANREGLLHGKAEDWVADLVPFVVDNGIGTFVLMSDDPADIEQFATGVIPALREVIARDYPNLATGSAMRHAAVRARRSPGIDYDAIPASLRDNAIEPGDALYPRVKSTYIRGGEPGLVLKVSTAVQVAEALAFVRKHPDLPMSVRSGGHGISGRSTNRGGIVIDLGQMNEIEVIDEATRRVRIGAAARWMDVAAALAPHGWALSSGDYGGVGVGGLATAGGIGWLVREHGLTIDHLRAAEMVLADGSIVRVSDTENPDLFWAIRGAGANFGIVTWFEFEVDEVGNVGFAQLAFDANDIAGFLESWGTVVENSPRDLTSFLIMGGPRPGQPAIAQTMTVVDSSDPDTIISRLQPMAEVAPMLQQQVVITPYMGIMANAQGSYHQGQGEPTARSGLVNHITPEFAKAAERLIRSGAVYFFQIRSAGGAVADVHPDATAYANRAANFSVIAFGGRRNQLNAAWDELRPYFDGLYLSFDTDQRQETIEAAFPPRTLERLRDLKAHYDPDNIFRDNFNILVPQPIAL